MKNLKNIALVLLFLYGSCVFSQGYNNRWINFGQTYLKTKVYKDGIYRLDSATLAGALTATGNSLASIDPRSLQLFQKGKELYVYVAGESDGVFNGSDYILFYAEGNKGSDDSLLFDKNIPFVTNPYYSVINDSATVFITWNGATSNKRLTVDTDTTYSTYSASPYYYKEIYSPSGGYFLGAKNFVNQDDPRYLLGEGRIFSEVQQPNPYSANWASFSFQTALAYRSTPQASVTVCYSGGNDILSVYRDHIVKTTYLDNLSNNSILKDNDSISAYVTHRFSYTIDPAKFSNYSSITVTNLANPWAATDNYIEVDYISVFLPHQFDMQDLTGTEEKIYLPDDGAQAKSKLVLSNYSGTSPVMIDVTNHRLLTVTSSGSNFLSLVSNGGGNKMCYLAGQSAINNITQLLPINRRSTPGKFVKYINGSVPDSVYIMISNPRLMYTPGNHGANDYKNWRTSGLGGGNFNVVLASTEDLADQFGYGVDLSPISMRNFCKFLIDTSISTGKRAPSNLLLIGKGVHPVDLIQGGGMLGAPSAFADKCFVPTWGNPACDILITQGLPGSVNYEPAIPTGRLAVVDDGGILAYLSKAQLHETQADDSLWMKRAIHFVGGNTASDQHAFQSYMNVCRSIYTDTAMGGDVHTFQKTSSAPVSVTTNDSVRQLINSGVSLMTFFGHGSPTGFDENIDDPQNYTYGNFTRFPFILANSCYTGDINNAELTSHSELFTLAPNNHGCIGYVATVTEGVANTLAFYAQEIYRQFSYKNYGNSYGTSVRNTVRQLIGDMSSNYANDTMVFFTALEMTLHGDPALRSYGKAKPDYTLTNQDVIFNTTSYPDKIGVKIIMTNLGRAKKENYNVLLRRFFPNGDTVNYYQSVAAPYYKDTISFLIDLDYYRAVGKNDFFVSLDDNMLIPELSETNNTTNGKVSVFIKGGDIEPVWPYKFAIVPGPNKVILKASTADPFAPMTTYRFQVDTNDSFQSLLVNTTINAVGGVVSLPVNLYGIDSTVYYWRVAKDTTAPNWKESSFQVLAGKYGWGQSHFNQFKGDNYQYVTYNKPQRRFDFFNTVKTIHVNDNVSLLSNAYTDYTNIQFFYNGNQQHLWTCVANGWSIAVFDSITGNLWNSDTLLKAPWMNGPLQTYYGTYGNCVCDWTNRTVFDFGNFSGKCDDTTTIWQPQLQNFIASIPAGEYVLAYRVMFDTSYRPQPHKTATIDAFKTIGSAQIDNLTDSTVLIIFGRKTNGPSPGAAHEVLATRMNEHITLTDSIVPHFDKGFIATDLIGPCKKSDTAWKSLHWCFKNLETAGNDVITIAVNGIDTMGQKVQLALFTKDSLDVLDLSNYVNGKKYPYIQLVANEADSVMNTPPQLKRWQVIFDQAPECAIDPPSGYSVVKSSVAEGETYEMHVPIKNISDFKFEDSLVVTYSLEDANRVSHSLPYKLKKRPFLPDAVIVDTVKVNTLGYSGTNNIWVDVNPPKKPFYQLEQFHFNNIMEMAFDVNRDKINPVLDVTFDGVHILNGDIVSAKPVVLVSLKDENKFLALNDTSNFRVSLLAPGASKETKLNFNDNTLLFTPAQLPNNSCKINYRPALLQDGIYTLHIIANDRSKNASGQFDYRIQFDVVNKPSITEVLNYPNPFSTSTRFVFTITGSEVPETFKIQILTITGRVVREITREELGFLHVGRNITDYAWDGKDQYGDQLANGVYLYRVQTRLNGEEIDHLSTSADSYFKKGMGKMLLIR